MKVKLEPSSPIKINDYHVKCNRYSNKDKVHINKRTKLSEPNKSEITFDFTKIPEREQEDTEYTDSIQEIIASKITKSKVNITGQVTVVEIQPSSQQMARHWGGKNAQQNRIQD